jgi:2-methylcitrate dehydratase PrpD
MVKPLHAGMAARNGLMAARLARRGCTSSADALDGPQGYLSAMDSEHLALEPAVTDLGFRWEILQSGITVKLYPSCAATHPPLDALLALRREAAFTHEQVDAIAVEVDSMTPRLLIHDRPATGLEAKFSMPFCAAAAVVHGRLGIDTFDVDTIHEAAIQSLMPRVSLRANPALDTGAALSKAHVTVTLRDGRVLQRSADGARGYPGRVSSDELAIKFAACAARTLSPAGADAAWEGLQRMSDFANARDLTALLSSAR